MQQRNENIHIYKAGQQKKCANDVVGGVANFHGYQRHSSDVDFWIDASSKNLNKSIEAFIAMGHEVEDLPSEMKINPTWHVLSLQDLISSKIKAVEPKDLLDIQKLKRI